MILLCAVVVALLLHVGASGAHIKLFKQHSIPVLIATFMMMYLTALMIIASLALCSAGDGVVTLSTNNFMDTVKASDDQGWMVKFYAPWCGHCKKLAPTWDKLAAAAEGNFGVAKVDCTTNQALCGQHKVTGYPTIKFFKNNKVYAYKGGRTVDQFKSFASSNFESATSSEF